MKILNTRYFGSIARCNSCGCILGYAPTDVAKDQTIKCPQCNFTIWVPLDPNYDGIIKEESEDKKNGKAVVPEQ